MRKKRHSKRFCITLIISLLLLPLLSFSKSVTIKGIINEGLDSKKDSVYVGIVWHKEDNWTFQATYGREVGRIKNGKFKFKVTNPPADSSCILLANSKLSVAFIFAFKDTDGNGVFSASDPIIGLSDSHCLTFVAGNLNLDIEKAEKTKGEEVLTLSRLLEGIQLCKVVTKQEQNRRYGFDDLVPITKATVKIRIFAHGAGTFKTPNWT